MKINRNRVGEKRRASQQGSISIVFVCSLPIMLILFGMVMAVSMHLQAANRAIYASEAAAFSLAIKNHVDDEAVMKYAEYYKPYMAEIASEPRVTKRVDAADNTEYQVTVAYGFESTATMLINERSSDVVVDGHSTSKISISRDAVDVALVLDVSGSMGSDIADLKNIINEALPEQNQGDTVRFSVIPFSGAVGVKDVRWLPESNGKLMCVSGLSETNSTVDIPLTVKQLDFLPGKLNIKATKENEWLADCSDSGAILPLDADLTVVKNKIDSLSTGGTTASYQGLIWGVRTLLDEWSFDWSVEDKSGTNITKRLILFTDGQDNGSVFDDLTNAGFCEKVKSELNIEMSFIGYGVDSSRIRQFQSCAGGSEYVFDAQNTAELRTYLQAAIKGAVQSNLSVRH